MHMSSGLEPAMPWLQVTFFWNGNRSGYFKEELETYVEIPSDNVPFNEAPEMKAREITEAGKEALLSGKYDMVRVNYANPGRIHVSSPCIRLSSCGCHLLMLCPEQSYACSLSP